MLSDFWRRYCRVKSICIWLGFLLVPTTIAYDNKVPKPSVVLNISKTISFTEVRNHSYLGYVEACFDNLIEYGIDRYGEKRSPLLVSSLDVVTKDNLNKDSLDVADEKWRVERRQRRSPGGMNFLFNQSIYQAMNRVSSLTGNLKYTHFVNDNLKYAMDNLVDSNGLFWWGWHRHYDVHTDELLGDDYHEMHAVNYPLWNEMWQLNSAAVKKQIQQIWLQHVVDKNTGRINRHNNSTNDSASFITSSASFIDAFAFLSSKVDEGENNTWLNRAKLLANYVYSSKNTSTGLVPHTSNLFEVEDLSHRWDTERSATTTPGVLVPMLFRAYQYTGDKLFYDQAFAYLLSWGKYSYDPSSGSFWGSVKLNGIPVKTARLNDGSYGQYEPRGLIDLWAPEAITAEYNTDAALAYINGYQITQDIRLLETSKHWASLIIANLPATSTLKDTWYHEYSTTWAPLGTYAEHYGHGIDFFIKMYLATNNQQHLNTARNIADSAISSLWYDGLFRGHPNKQYFEAIDGVGVLLNSLISLHRYQQK